MARFGFDGLPDANLNVTVRGGGASAATEVVVSCSGIRRSLHLSEAHTQLHWACLEESGAWAAPAVQPPNSRPIDAAASRISLDQCNSTTLSFPPGSAPSSIIFVVLVEAHGQQHWLKASGGKDFVVDVLELAAKSAPPTSPMASGDTRVAERPTAWPALDEAKAAAAADMASTPKDSKGKKRVEKKKAMEVAQGTLDVEGGLGRLVWQVVPSKEQVAVFLEASVRLSASAEIFLHWGCQEAPGGEWMQPAEAISGATPQGDGKASRTVFESQARAVLRFPAKIAPAGVAFVLYAAVPGAGEQWLKTSGGGDFVVPVAGFDPSAAAAGPADSFAKKFCDAETKYTHWSQFQRVCMANEVLSQPSTTSSDLAWLAADLRLAQAKQLEWYRNRGYQPKDMAHAQEALGGNLGQAYAKAESTLNRTLLRLAAPAVPRGSSGGGDAIRHGILNIMRTHGIKEGHRPGIECKFIEQWHQKLHTNSAPDDIVICEGYLAFLASGNPDDLWRTIWERGKITRDDLSKMCTSGFKDHTKSGASGLNVTPLHLPQLTNDMNGYLGLLKHVHGGTDLFSLCEACKGQYPDHGAECMAFEIFHGRDDPFTMGKIVDLRRALGPSLWKRDVLMLDVAMEAQLRALAERADLDAIGKDDLIGHLRVLLDDLSLSRRDKSLGFGMDMLLRLTTGDHGGHERWSVEWCKLMHAACDRIALVCATITDEVGSLLQGCADSLVAAGKAPGAVFKPAQASLEAFGEETARCLTERLVAQTLKRFMPLLRRGAGLGPWEIVSQGVGGQAIGKVQAMSALPTALEDSSVAVVAVLEHLTGWEDIPAGIVAVILPAAHAVDVLSHVAIRARNQKVLLASCDDDARLSELRAAAGSRLRLEVTADGGVAWAQAAADAAPQGNGGYPGGAATNGSNGLAVAVKVERPPAPPARALGAAKFVENRRSLGGKSLHLAELRPKSGEYSVPASVTVPFGIFEEVLAADANEEVREELEDLLEQGDLAQARRHLVDNLEVPVYLEEALTKELASAKAPPLVSASGSAEWQRALKAVWASKWTERAVSSRQQMRIDDSMLFLAVLVQPLVSASYAFVIHTKCPLPGANAEEQLIEICIGLGESLVSNTPGRALSASVGPSGRPSVVHTYPSKPDGVFTPQGGSYIFRSDSNGEDLEGFAGAGLYDSVTVESCLHQPVAYADEQLLFNASARETLLRRLYDLGRLVEANFKGQPQDIEGAVASDGSLVVTQSRPQV